MELHWGTGFDWDTDQHAKICLSAPAITGLDPSVVPDDYLGGGSSEKGFGEPFSVCKAPNNRCLRLCASSYDENYNAICDTDCQDCKRDCNSFACTLAFTAICKSTEDSCKDMQGNSDDQCAVDVLVFFVCPALLCVCCCRFNKTCREYFCDTDHIELSESNFESLQLELLAEDP